MRGKQIITNKTCEFCGETILKVAKKCKHCGEFVITKEVSTDNKQQTKWQAKQQAKIDAWNQLDA